MAIKQINRAGGARRRILSTTGTKSEVPTILGEAAVEASGRLFVIFVIDIEFPQRMLEVFECDIESGWENRKRHPMCLRHVGYSFHAVCLYAFLGKDRLNEETSRPEMIALQ